jgi:flagellum-specific peptidoglycan hydrolase FlgJ
MVTLEQKRRFLQQIKQASALAKQSGAVYNEAVLFAQAALESRWGSSELTQKANNLFGIKAGKGWTGQILSLSTKEWSKQKGWYMTTADWCKWDSWAGCVLYYYTGMLKRLSWFRDALQHVNCADDFLRALLPEPGQPGWATDPNYFSKVRMVGAEIERLGGPKWV